MARIEDTQCVCLYDCGEQKNGLIKLRIDLYSVKYRISKQNTGHPLTEVLSADSSPSLVAASSVIKFFFRR